MFDIGFEDELRDEDVEKFYKKIEGMAGVLCLMYDGSYRLTLYSKSRINEGVIIKYVTHEFTEATLDIILLRILSHHRKVIRKMVPYLSHILSEISLYDDKEPIVISASRRLFKGKIEKFLKKIGSNYIKVKEGDEGWKLKN
jgi:hypothetical protein